MVKREDREYPYFSRLRVSLREHENYENIAKHPSINDLSITLRPNLNIVNKYDLK